MESNAYSHPPFSSPLPYRFLNQAQQQRFGDLMGGLGVDNYGWSPAFADYKVILENLKSQDEMVVYEAVSNLQNQLAVAQENTLSNFMIDQYIPALIEIVKGPAMSDISNEINCKASSQLNVALVFAVQCLTNLMDIFPTICNSIVSHGAVKALCDVMERSMGFIDLSEACIKAFDKISTENPYAILTSGALSLCLNMMDFFESNTQKRILTLLLNASRHSASEQDFDAYFAPVLPVLCMFINLRNENQQGSQEKVECISSILLRTSESFLRFFSPQSQFDKVAAQFAKLASCGILEAVSEALFEYSLMDSAHNVSVTGSPEKGGAKGMTNLTIQNFLKLLSLCSRFSLNITQSLVNSNVFKIIDGFIPSQDDQRRQHYSADQFPFIIDSINLLDNLFPEREETLMTSEVADKARALIEKEKRHFYQNQEQNKIAFVAEKILPKLFSVYENIMTQLVRTKTLQIIEKIISLFNNELLNNFIEPYSFAKFIYSNFKSHNLTSIQICLEMVNKLMQSNPKTYTLPLMREGILEYIKKLSSEEGFEKMLGPLLQQKEKDGHQEEIESIINSKTAFLRAQQEQTVDADQKLQFEHTLQRYLEAARQQYQLPGSIAKLQQEQQKQIIALAQSLCAQYFSNEQFMSQIKEQCSQEFQLLSDMTLLAQKIKEAAAQPSYNELAFKDLLSQLVSLLTNKRHVMSYEFKESGLLQALDYFLTYTPSQVKLLIQKEQAQDKGEEMKHSEEMLLSNKHSTGKKVTKKEARTFIQRLRLFTHYILSQANDKSVLGELVQLCHDLLSQSESEIFEISNEAQKSAQGSLFASGGASDLNASVNALKQLSKRIRVNLVYDQHKKPVEPSPSPSLHGLTKSKSHHPAFTNLGAAEGGENEHSKVYLKRHQLYTELKSVLLSVEQCASLSLLEDFLRNKIRSIADVKALKTPTSFYESMGKQQRSQGARAVMEATMQKLKDIISQTSGGAGRDRSDSEEYAVLLADEILNSKDLTPDEQFDIIRQLELQSLQMMESLYGGDESPVDENSRSESFEERLLNREAARDRQGEEELEAEQRVYDFHRTIEKIKQIFKEKQLLKKKDPLAEEFALQEQKLLLQRQQNVDQLMKTSEMILNEEEEEDEEEASQEALRQQQVIEKQLAGEDVEMTDEEEEEKRNRKEEQLRAQRYMAYAQKQPPPQREFDLQAEEFSIQHQETFGIDLEELIKTNGDDIEFEFSYNGVPCNLNQTIFELFKQQDKATRSPFSYSGEQQTSIHFSIKDKRDEFKSTHLARNDSLSEFNFKRQRALSEAVDDMSISAVNTLVQQLIEKEFQVFPGSQGTRGEGKDGWMEQSLKILKVLHFLCKHINLISSQGIKFLVNTLSNENDNLQEEPGFTDYDLQVSLSRIHPNMFHHHKLDLYIVKNIQDPYNIVGGGITDTLQQIFRNCPFLFPFSTRHLFFQLVSFIGAIDMNRSIYFLRQFLKAKGGKIAEDKALKLQKQKVVVDRSRVLDSAFNLIKQLNKRAFLEVQYQEEQGTGLGPTMEFYYIVADELTHKKKEIWRPTMPDNGLFPAPLALNGAQNDDIQKVYELFRLAGTIIAKSIVDDRLIDLPLSSLFWDLLLGKVRIELFDSLFQKMNLFDLERVDKDLFRAFAELQQLANKKRMIDKQTITDQETKNRQINALRTGVTHPSSQPTQLQQNARVEDLSLYFLFPGYEGMELKPNGKNTEVTIHNLQEYIDLVMNFMFHETVKVQISAFKKGFNSIFSIDSLKSFSTADELEEMICGTNKNDEEWTNIQVLSENIIPAHGYHQKSVEYLNFLRFLSEMTREERTKFLKFVTGSPRLPNGGFASLDPKLTLVLKKPQYSNQLADNILPSVMTCQNYVKLPSYSSYDVLSERLRTAYNEGNSHFALN